MLCRQVMACHHEYTTKLAYEAAHIDLDSVHQLFHLLDEDGTGTLDRMEPNPTPYPLSLNLNLNGTGTLDRMELRHLLVYFNDKLK